METDELMIVESSSSLHLTVSEEEPAPALSKLSSSSSASSASLDDDDETIENEQPSEKLAAAGAQNAQSENVLISSSKKNNTTTNNSNGDKMEESGPAKEGLDEEPPSPQQTLEILNSEQQVDGSLHIEIKDDGCGDPEEAPSAKIQRLARKAGIIVGGGTMTAVGTVMLFLPCPTPSIYLMIGGMAIMSKEIPAAQRHLDTTREGLKGWVERAEKEFADGVRTITVVVDNGSPHKKNKKKMEPKVVEEEEEVEEAKVVAVVEEEPTEKPKENRSPNAITSTQVVHQRKNPVKKHFVKSCRNVIIPLLNKVCTPQELLDQQQAAAAAAAAAGEPSSTEGAETISPEPSVKTPTSNEEPVQENTSSPVTSPFARWAKYRETRREELLKAEEQREREAMLARINEANLKKLQQEANIENKVVPENQEEEEEEDEQEEEEVPELSESLQRLMFQSESAVIRV